jgi:hypothetical protein
MKDLSPNSPVQSSPVLLLQKASVYQPAFIISYKLVGFKIVTKYPQICQ